MKSVRTLQASVEIIFEDGTSEVQKTKSLEIYDDYKSQQRNIHAMRLMFQMLINECESKLNEE